MTDPIFLGNNEPIGATITLDNRTPRNRLASCFIESEMLFRYFESLSNRSTGWGISYNKWLEVMHGWKHVGYKTYERIDYEG
jgi:hypothetical protein